MSSSHLDPQTHWFHYIPFRHHSCKRKNVNPQSLIVSGEEAAVRFCKCLPLCLPACLLLAVGIIPVLVRLWSLAFPCTASACGVAHLLPVCVRGSLVWFIGPWHTALWTPPLLLEWLSHVLVVDPPGWFSTDGGQMWSCSRASGERALQTVWRECLQKLCLQAASVKSTSFRDLSSVLLTFLHANFKSENIDRAQ